jgi:hypothetical protein
MISLDKTYKTRTGSEVVIHAIYPNNKDSQVQGGIVYNDYVQMQSWTIEGGFFEDGTNRTSGLDLVEVSPYEDWKIDDKVIVSFDDDKEYNYYFAGLDGLGRTCVFSGGTTSWSSDGLLITVSNIKKAEEL